jgi:hypothetical protein
MVFFSIYLLDGRYKKNLLKNNKICIKLFFKAMSCQHDVTMTLFSRVFYDAKAIEDFPTSLRENINKDHRGRFYEDFYR